MKAFSRELDSLRAILGPLGEELKSLRGSCARRTWRLTGHTALSLDWPLGTTAVSTPEVTGESRDLRAERLWDFLVSPNVFQTLLSSQKSPVSNMDCKFPRAEGRKHRADPPVSPQSNVYHRALCGKQPGVSEARTPPHPHLHYQKMSYGSCGWGRWWLMVLAKDTDGINSWHLLQMKYP